MVWGGGEVVDKLIKKLPNGLLEKHSCVDNSYFYNSSELFVDIRKNIQFPPCRNAQ
jgi:hypothetical protein